MLTLIYGCESRMMDELIFDVLYARVVVMKVV